MSSNKDIIDLTAEEENDTVMVDDGSEMSSDDPEDVIMVDNQDRNIEQAENEILPKDVQT
jgi:hypothetical protein